MAADGCDRARVRRRRKRKTPWTFRSNKQGTRHPQRAMLMLHLLPCSHLASWLDATLPHHRLTAGSNLRRINGEAEARNQQEERPNEDPKESLCQIGDFLPAICSPGDVQRPKVLRWREGRGEPVSDWNRARPHWCELPRLGKAGWGLPHALDLKLTAGAPVHRVTDISCSLPHAVFFLRPCNPVVPCCNPSILQPCGLCLA